MLVRYGSKADLMATNVNVRLVPGEPRSATPHGEAACGFSAPTQDMSGAFTVARNDPTTAWAQSDEGETKCPTPGMLMVVASNLTCSKC